MMPGSVDEYFKMAVDGKNIKLIVIVFFAQFVIFVVFFILGRWGEDRFYIRYPIYLISALLGIHGIYFAIGAITTFINGDFPGGFYLSDTIEGMGLGIMLFPWLFIRALYRFHQRQLEE